MDAVLQQFEDRVTETDAYLDLLASLERPDVRLQFESRPHRRNTTVDDVCIKVMRATAFLMMYNLIEASIRSAFDHVYERIRSEQRTIDQVSAAIRDVWIGQQHRQKSRSSASADTYRKLVEEVVEQILGKSAVSLDPERLPYSGTLDARAIRDVCGKHGISRLVIHYRAKGGAELVTVKQQRNALAHGNISFAECGQQYTAEDLIRIKRQAVVFGRGVLNSIKKYVDNNEYAA